MKNLLFVGAHLGYPMDRTPLGGGAMVGLHLLRRWSAASGVRVLALGPGSAVPCGGVEYHRLETGLGPDPELVKLSELGYARFSRSFEAAATRFILSRERELPPGETVVVVNDVTEAPDLRALARGGWRAMSLWHVDVVDYFNRMYLGGLLSPERATALWDRAARAGLDALLPDVLHLVFAKQKAVVEESWRLAVPSRAMARTLARCYPGRPRDGKPPVAERTRVVPWGVWEEPAALSETELEREAARLRAHFQLGPRTRVLMTLSRISPEKGLERLLGALRSVEGEFPDLAVFICGEPAFMRGVSYARAVRRAAARLFRARVFFPGYLDAERKRVFFRVADLFVSPSRHESYGLTIAEALREGVPVLACGHYGVEELLEEGYGRRLREDEPAEAGLARGLRELLADPARLRAMGAKAREASRRMGFERSADRLLEEALSIL
ncbi:MAG: glycosyltransferase family 4 protein [Elusimicrobiota bacterium]